MKIEDKVNDIEWKPILQKAGSDFLALAALNSAFMAPLEVYGAGMTAHDSANVRTTVALTNPLFGIVRDYVKARVKKAEHVSKIERKENILIDVGMGIGNAMVGLVGDFAKYYLARKAKGEDFNIHDLKAAGWAFAYSVICGDLMGIAVDTYRDGLGIERKDDSRSLFPKEINPKVKKAITYTLGTATIAGLGEFFAKTR